MASGLHSTWLWVVAENSESKKKNPPKNPTTLFFSLTILPVFISILPINFLGFGS